MAKSIMETVAAAKAAVPAITPQELKDLLAGPGGGGVLVVDVRDAPEVAASGKVQGAVHVSRGMLEFRADDTIPSHDPAFDRGKTVVLYCGSGGRSALAGRALQELGYRDVRNLGGFKDWAEAGGAVEKA